MTEYEAASLALQKASLTLQEASIALQEASLATQQAAVWVAAVVGAVQCALIAYGLYIMRQAARHRDAQHRENMAQHRETMKALETASGSHGALKAERETQSEQHRETMAGIERRHRETMAALEGQRESLRELIRRTSAPHAAKDS